MPVLRYYSSVAQPTTLAGGISAGAATMTVAATTGFPSSFPYTLAVDYGSASEELVEVTNAAGPVLTVTRGVDGTSAQSHGGGAVVRHVISARDFADFQAHQAATSDVHGVTGALVGASSTQTLANKTLTSPVINSGAMSGTFTGNPTFSGTPVLAAGASLTGTFTGSPTLSGAPAFTGAPVFSGGALFQRASATSLAHRASVTADTQDRLQVQADGRHLWGSGAATLDTTLYRNAAGELKTDGAFTAAGALSAANFPSGGMTSWTPVWSTSTGLHAPSYGNAAVGGGFIKFGRLLFFTFNVTFGSSTNFGSGATTADNWGFSLPGSNVATSLFAGTAVLCGSGRAVQSNANVVPLVVRVDATGANFNLDVNGGQPTGAALVQTGAIDSATPWAWANTNTLSFFGVVECTA
jgi:hypothetical protein